MRFSAQAKATAVALELKTIRDMYLSEKDYNEKLEALLRRTQLLRHIPESGNVGDVSTIQVRKGIDGSPSGGVLVPAHYNTAMASV